MTISNISNFTTILLHVCIYIILYMYTCIVSMVHKLCYVSENVSFSSKSSLREDDGSPAGQSEDLNKGRHI